MKSPTVSSDGAKGITPPVASRANVGLKPHTPQYDAGRSTLPRVCVPSANGTMPAATAAADPELLPPGAFLGGFFFIADKKNGPPFGIAAGDLEDLLSPYFERLDDMPVTDSIPVFAGLERWQLWQRRP